ncbi:rRNA-processing protein and EBNA1-binding protein ebp2, partial [Ceratobasidium sp. 423]
LNFDYTTLARTAANNLKASWKLSKPKAKPPSPPLAEAPTSTGAEADDEPSDEDSEDSGDHDIDEEGMSKLMKLLGDDGLDEVAEQQLREEVAEGGDDASESGWVDEDGEIAGPESDVAGKLQFSATEEAVDEEDNDDEENGEDVALDEASEVDEDIVPKQNMVINNEVALKRIRETIELGKDMPYSTSLEIPNADDDLNRELAFYKQALDTANTARSKFAAAKLPFSRPSNYFAEMVKSDSPAKKQRELKKIDKQVQVEKLKEREKGKKEMNERVKGLKRKRCGALDTAQDSEAFDVAVEDAISDRPAKRGKGGGKLSMSRTKRDAKFGFGGACTKGRRGKQNTKQITESFDFRGGMGEEAAKRGTKWRRQAWSVKTTQQELAPSRQSLVIYFVVIVVTNELTVTLLPKA